MSRIVLEVVMNWLLVLYVLLSALWIGWIGGDKAEDMATKEPWMTVLLVVAWPIFWFVQIGNTIRRWRK